MQPDEKMSVLSRIKRFMHSTTEVIPGVFQITFRGANVFLIVENKLTLIDTGLRDGVSHIVDFIRHIGHSPEEVDLIILTHNHIDHMGGLAELKKITGARVAIHKNDIGERKHPPAADSRYREPLARVEGKLRSLFSVMPEDVDIKLEGGEVLEQMGGLEVIHTPGHTPGSICLFSGSNNMLIAGDLLRKKRKTLLLPPRIVNYNPAEAMESVRKVSRYEIDILCFGHGLPLVEDVSTRIQDMLERGRD